MDKGSILGMGLDFQSASHSLYNIHSAHKDYNGHNPHSVCILCS